MKGWSILKVRGYRVFYIDEEEGVRDLIELIRTTPVNKLALVVRNGFLILNSTVNLKLIKKYADKYNKDLIFVNPDPVLVDKVINFNFAIYPDLNALEKNIPFQVEAAGKEQDFEDDDSPGKKKKGNVFSALMGVFLCLLILVMAYFYFLYPTAIIEIRPVVKEMNYQFKIAGSTSLNSIDWDDKRLPIHQTEVEITGEDEIETTGVKLLGETKSSGIVKIINERSEDVKIPDGTLLSTSDGKKYQTLEELVVPKLTVDYLMDVAVGMKAGMGEVRIEALEKGSNGNVGIGRINAFVNKLEDIHVINPEPTSSGKDKRIPFVTEDDIDNLKSSIKEELESKLVTRMYKKLGGNYYIIEEGLSYSEPEIKFNHQAGDEADILKATASLTASGYLIRNNELDRLATKIIQNKLENNMQLMNSGVNITKLKLEDSGQGMYNITIGLLVPVIPAIDTDNLADSLIGMDIAAARDFLEHYSNINDFNIKTEQNKLPRLGFAIKVVVMEPDSLSVFGLQ